MTVKFKKLVGKNGLVAVSLAKTCDGAKFFIVVVSIEVEFGIEILLVETEFSVGVFGHGFSLVFQALVVKLRFCVLYGVIVAEVDDVEFLVVVEAVFVEQHTLLTVAIHSYIKIAVAVPSVAGNKSLYTQISECLCRFNGAISAVDGGNGLCKCLLR
jgi:hypothetical protein